MEEMKQSTKIFQKTRFEWLIYLWVLLVLQFYSQIAVSIDEEEQPYIMGYYSLDGVVGPVQKYQYREGVVKPQDWEVLMSRAEALGNRGEYYRSIWVYNSVFKNDYLYGRMTPGQRYKLHISLGKVLMKIGMLDRAESTLYEAVSLHAEPFEAYFVLGMLEAHSGNVHQATIHLKNCLYLRPDHLFALKNLGSLLYASGNIAEGEHYLQRLVAFQQISMDSEQSDDFQQSPDLSQSQKLSQWISNFITSAFQLEFNEENQTLSGASAILLTKALEQPQGAIFFEISTSLWHAGFWEIAQHQTRLAQDFTSRENGPLETVVLIHAALEFPPVADSVSHLSELRARLEMEIEALLDDLEYNENSRMQHVSSDYLQGIFAPISVLHWQGTPTKLLLRDIAQLIEGVCPELRWTSASAESALETEYLSWPYKKLHTTVTDQDDDELAEADNDEALLIEEGKQQSTDERKQKKRRRRHVIPEESQSEDSLSMDLGKGEFEPVQVNVGLVSAHFHLHPVGRIALSMLHALRSPGLHFTIFAFPTIYDEVTHHFRNIADQYIVLPKNITEARDIITATKPSIDILLYPDWPDPYTYLLSYFRLAPVQGAFFVRGATSGIHSLDFYFIGEYALSGNHFSRVSRWFCEQVVELQGLGWPPISWVPFAVVDPVYEFRGYLFYEHQHIYTVAVPAPQLHPSFDDALVQILQGDPDGILVFLSDPTNARSASEHFQWYRRVLKRIRQKIKTKSVAANRVVLLPSLTHREYLSFLGISSILLDPFPISSPTTVMEALLQTKTPVVSLELLGTDDMYTLNFGSGLCKAMDIEAYCCASSTEDYITQALRIGANSTLQYIVKQDIKQAYDTFQKRAESFASDFQRALYNIGAGSAQVRNMLDRKRIEEQQIKQEDIKQPKVRKKKKKRPSPEFKVQSGYIQPN